MSCSVILKFFGRQTLIQIIIQCYNQKYNIIKNKKLKIKFFPKLKNQSNQKSKSCDIKFYKKNKKRNVKRKLPTLRHKKKVKGNKAS